MHAGAGRPAYRGAKRGARRCAILDCSMVLPVLGLGFRGRFLAGFGRKAGASGPKSGRNLPGAESQEEGLGRCTLEPGVPAYRGAKSGCSALRYFRLLNGASGPWAGLPGPSFGVFLPQS